MDTHSYGALHKEAVWEGHTKERLEHMIGKWQVFTSISSLLNGIPTGGISRELDHTLRVLAAYGTEDRCALFLLTDDRLSLERAHAWTASGTKPYPEISRRLRLDAFPWLRENILRGTLIHAPRLEDLPPEAGAWKDHLERQGIRAQLVVPLLPGGAPVGCLMVESTTGQKTWGQEDISLFRNVAGILASACMRKRTDEDLALCRERLRALSSELILAEEKERRRIASDLHDRIGHALAITSMKLKMLGKNAPPDLCAPLHDITGLVDELIRETQDMTFSITPPVLHDFGLGAAVEWLAEDTRRRHGLEVGLVCSIDDSLVDGGSRTFAYRAIRELLFNTVKHARATHVSISISEKNSRLHTVIEDDGTGFIPAADSAPGNGKGGFGLLSIREKLYAYGGTLLVERLPEKGTRITMVSPLTGEGS